MSDLFLHDVHTNDLAILDRAIARRLYYEDGIEPTSFSISVARNRQIKAWIRSAADTERKETVAYQLHGRLWRQVARPENFIGAETMPSHLLLVEEISDEVGLVVFSRAEMKETEALLRAAARKQSVSVTQEY